MKVILTSNIKKIGKVGDLVYVKDGFARNFLIPQKKALRENKKNLEYFEKIKEEVTKKEEAEKDKAKKIINDLKKIKIEFYKEADEKDQLYGSISKREVQKYLTEKNINIISDDIQIIEPIKSIGTHKIFINPYEGIKEEISVQVKKS